MADSMQRLMNNGASVCRMYSDLPDGEVLAVFAYVEDAKDWASRRMAAECEKYPSGSPCWFSVADTNSGKVWAYRQKLEKTP